MGLRTTEAKEKFKDKNLSIAIDGPNGSGKSTVAKLLAHELNIVYIDTGAMYRAVALYLLNKNISPNNPGETDVIIKEAMDSLDIIIKYIGDSQRVFLFNEDVTDKLRTREVTDASSKFAVNKHIREKLVELQRKLALETSVVMDGRDIGACVLPNATLKIYLDADTDVRTGRRVREYAEKGIKADCNVIKEEIIERDNRDKNREHSPLTKASDAVVIDSSWLDADGVKNKILELLVIK